MGKPGRPRKWTRDRSAKTLRKMKKWLKDDPEIIYIGQLFVKADLQQKLFSIWRKRFKDDEEIQSLANRIKGELETRINVGGMNGDLHWKMCQFNLINHYSGSWKDTKHINFKGSIKKQVDDKVVSILDEINDKIEKENQAK